MRSSSGVLLLRPAPWVDEWGTTGGWYTRGGCGGFVAKASCGCEKWGACPWSCALKCGGVAKCGGGRYPCCSHGGVYPCCCCCPGCPLCGCCPGTSQGQGMPVRRRTSKFRATALVLQASTVSEQEMHQLLSRHSSSDEFLYTVVCILPSRLSHSAAAGGLCREPGAG